MTAVAVDYADMTLTGHKQDDGGAGSDKKECTRPLGRRKNFDDDRISTGPIE